MAPLQFHGAADLCNHEEENHAVSVITGAEFIEVRGCHCKALCKALYGCTASSSQGDKGGRGNHHQLWSSHRCRGTRSSQRPSLVNYKGFPSWIPSLQMLYSYGFLLPEPSHRNYVLLTLKDLLAAHKALNGPEPSHKLADSPSHRLHLMAEQGMWCSSGERIQHGGKLSDVGLFALVLSFPRALPSSATAFPQGLVTAAVGLSMVSSGFGSFLGPHSHVSWDSLVDSAHAAHRDSIGASLPTIIKQEVGHILRRNRGSRIHQCECHASLP